VNLDKVIDDTTFNFYNGAFQEHFNALATSNGTVITMTLTNSAGGDYMTEQWSSGNRKFDVSGGGATIVLEVGTDTVPKMNYVYRLESDNILTSSISGFPTGVEHIKISSFYVQSATAVDTDGPLITHNWNDGLQGDNGQGHMAHMAERIRRDGAYYFSGLGPNGTDQAPVQSYFDYVSGSESYFKMTSGVIYQMHEHTISAFDSSQAGDHLQVINWFGDFFHEVSDLTDIVDDSTGTGLANKYFNLFFFAVGNKGGTHSPMMCQVPNGSYSTQTAAENDVDGYDNLAMPREFALDSSTGVPICRMTLRWSGANLTHISTTDLRSDGITAGGGGTGSLVEFPDNQFTIFDDGDVSRIATFQASGITTGNTREYTFPDADGILALTSQSDGTIDHGADLAGLTDDDHSGYLWLAGRAGGQVAYGGVNAGDDLTLHSGTADSKDFIGIYGGAGLLLNVTTGEQVTFVENDTGFANYNRTLVTVSTDATDSNWWNFAGDSVTTGTVLRMDASALTGAGKYIDLDGDFYVQDGGDVTQQGDLYLAGSNKELRFYEGANYVGFEAPALAADQIWVLPNADGGASEFLQTDGGGNLTWAAGGGGGGTDWDITADAGGSSTITDEDILDITGGTGIDTTLSGAGPYLVTLDFDSTEIGTTTWGSGSDIDWTFNVGAVTTDPLIEFIDGGADSIARITADDIRLASSDITIGQHAGVNPTVNIPSRYFTIKNGSQGTAQEFRMYDGDYFVGFKAHTGIPGLVADVMWELPKVDGSDGQVLTTDGSEILSFEDTVDTYSKRVKCQVISYGAATLEPTAGRHTLATTPATPAIVGGPIIPYTGMEKGDQVVVTATLPDTYVTGSAIVLRIVFGATVASGTASITLDGHTLGTDLVAGNDVDANMAYHANDAAVSLTVTAANTNKFLVNSAFEVTDGSGELDDGTDPNIDLVAGDVVWTTFARSDSEAELLRIYSVEFAWD